MLYYTLHPFIVEGNKELVQPGMPCTVGPGIYAMGRFGVRIEDDLLITPAVGEISSSFTRELVAV
jgi:Xaa-Pro aminopeptidase